MIETALDFLANETLGLGGNLKKKNKGKICGKNMNTLMKIEGKLT